MKKFKNVFLNLSVFTKISFITVLVIIVISLFSTFLLVRDYSREIQDRDRLLVEETTNKIYDFFESCYNDMYNQRTLLHSSGHIADILADTWNTPSALYQSDTLKKITDYMKALAYSNTEINSIIIFTDDGKNALAYSPATAHSVYQNYDFTELPYIEDFRKSDKSITVIYDKNPGYLSSASSGKSAPVLSFIVKMYTKLGNNPETPLGYMMLNYSPEYIDDTYRHLTAAANGNYYVINSDSTIVYSNDKSTITLTADSSQAAGNTIIVNREIGLSGIKIIGTLSAEKIRATTFNIVLKSVLITGAGILFIIIIVLLLHRHYAHRFRNLAEAMRNVSNGDFTTELPVNTTDEIGYLSRTFNTMSHTLNEYIDKTYLAETQRRTAELYALQAQINPHFLANTIECIRMNAVENDDYSSAGMLKDLGNLFRWMVRFDDDIVDVQSEMDYIDCYLNLMKFRFEDKLNISLDLSPEIYNLGIPRFTLQPVFENAISHGSSNNRDMLVSAQLLVDNGILTITVKDNGPGINETNLAKLREHIYGTATYKEFGVALRNIHSRITLLFGSQYGVTLNSRYALGTVVTITLPAKEKKELENYVQTAYRG